MRDTYKLWEEPGGIPDFVMEIVSPSTWRTDLGAKRDRYAALGVGEYWLHDPHANHINPALAGFSLVGKSYEPIPGIESTEGTLTIHSRTLGLDLCLKGKDLRFFDQVAGRFLLNRTEAEPRIAELERALAERKGV